MAGPLLNEAKINAISEIHNITMESAASAISNMIESTVSISNPQVTACKINDIAKDKLNHSLDGILFDEGKESIFVKIDYVKSIDVKGIEGMSLIVMNSDDAQIIVNKLMGLPPEVDDNFEFDEMRISAIAEVMNQMMGASSTSMAQMLNVAVDISPPETTVSDNNETLFGMRDVNPNDDVCVVTLDFKVDDVINSKFINILSAELANSMVNKLLGIDEDDSDSLMDDDFSSLLSLEKQDAIGELQNMTMGSAATAVSDFMNAKVWITTPKVSVAKAGKVNFDDLDPSICVKIKYVKGMHGASVLVLKQADVQLMVNHLMGMPAEVTDDFVFDEMSISAVSEIMNQMMGASATTLSEILGIPTDISTPEAVVIDSVEDILKINNIETDDDVCVISFQLTIDDVMQSHFVTMLSMDLANEMADKMLSSYVSNEVPTPTSAQNSKSSSNSSNKKRGSGRANQSESRVINNNSSAGKNVKVEKFNMGSFFDDEDDNFMTKEQFKNLRPLLDVPMEVAVIIGSTQRRIEEVSDFTKGTIIELDTMANEPVDIMVNGNLMARGEVVVVDDNFAVRITEIVK